jgi:hypothetical protein
MMNKKWAIISGITLFIAVAALENTSHSPGPLFSLECLLFVILVLAIVFLLFSKGDAEIEQVQEAGDDVR